MSESPNSGQHPDSSYHSPNSLESEEDFSVFDLAIVLAKHKAVILGLPLVTALVAVIYSLTLPPIYTATAKILPPQQSQSTGSGMLAQLGALGLGGLQVAKTPSELYISMLKSRTVADSLIQRFDLPRVFEQKLQSGTRASLAAATEITSGKDGIITIDVSDKDAKRAAEVANAYVDELRKLTNVLAITEASQRRLFFEQQFESAKKQLANAEVSARRALQEGGLAHVEGQSRAILETTARLRGQITVKEVQIGAMRTFATEQNSELQLAQQELESMRRQLARMEGAGNQKASERTSGGSGIDNVKLLRELKYHETIYDLLAKQYEMAKIDEAKDSAVVQVLDPAVEPDHRSKPRRSQIVLVWTLAALFAALLWAFVREAIDKIRSNPRHERRMRAFKRYLAWR